MKVIVKKKFIKVILLILKVANLKMHYLIKKCLDMYWKKITSKNHEIYTQSNKISLSCYDDKRYTRGDGINTLA